jgi:hypothetical protein
VIQRHLYDFADTVLVDVVHRETLDRVFSEDTTFRRVDVSESDVDAVPRRVWGVREWGFAAGLAC